ncbi:MAG: PQQ-binding-like beta-propeller repeat protein [Planctomycetaceae bacterium]|nr:PQQ-binding-like beta-propeller repeat protein [Planctomycetaceae bacterium]
MYRLISFLLVCVLSPLALAQEADTQRVNTLYESILTPDRPLERRIEQANRLFEAGRDSETAQLLGGILESANFAFVLPDSEEDPQPRTLHRTINDYIIQRIRSLSRDAQDSYHFQFEPTARRLLENAAAAGSLDDVQDIARKYFPTPSGASATFLVGLTQFERGDYTAARLTLERLKRLHPAIPDSLQPALDAMLASTLEEPQVQLHISQSAWLEQTGWRLPAGAPAQNADTQATAPLLETNWTVPMFNRQSQAADIDNLARIVRHGGDVYIPASQPLVVGDMLITRLPGETLAVDANTGKRLWIAAAPEYRTPNNNVALPSYQTNFGRNTRTFQRLFFWHDRISQQLSSDGDRLFGIDEHDLFGGGSVAFGRPAPNLLGRGEDLRHSPGNTLTARDLRTGQILWQVGKFPYVQKYIDALFSQPRNASQEQGNLAENLFTEDEKAFWETLFLGAPLPLQGRLYVIGETDSVLQLFALESQTGRLIARQPFAQTANAFGPGAVRRTYPLFPSASEGLIICPTGIGLVVALDATTLAPVWCFSYAPATRAVPQVPQNQNPIPFRPNVMLNQPMLFQRATNELALKQIFADSGWQVPGIVIDRHRVLVAPPDRPNLYCLDLRSGELLWEQSISRANALYVAGIYNDKAFLVTPVNMMTIDMNTGQNITTSESRFPAALKPAGVGVRNDNQYFIPFTDGHLAVADLNDGTLTWLDASGSATVLPEELTLAVESNTPQPPNIQPNIIPHEAIPLDALDGRMLQGQIQGRLEFRMEMRWEGGIMVDRQVQFSGLPPNPNAVSSVPPPNDTIPQAMQLGNLVGIKGRFFSQSPTQIASFDQKDALRQRSEMLLQADANDPDGLLKQGRILKSEGRLAEAIDSFRASLSAKHSIEAADALRRSLLEAMRTDFPAWADASQELEALAGPESGAGPEDWAAILHAQVEGIIQSGQTDALESVLEKVFAFGLNHSILIPVGEGHSTQLHRALGGLIEQNIVRGNRPELRQAWEELAETFLQRFATPGGFTPSAYTPPALAQSFRFFNNTVNLPPEIRRWSMFMQVFRNTSAANRASEILREEYVRHRLPIALHLRALHSPGTPSIIPWAELPAPFDWGPNVDVQVVPTVAHLQNLPPMQQDAARTEIDRIVNRLVASVQNPGVSRPGETFSPIPFFGRSDSQHIDFNYVIKQEMSGLVFCRTDLAGREQWRLALPATITSGYHESQSNRYSGEHTTFIKAFPNYRLLIHGTSMTAIDTTPQSERILWTRTLASMPVMQQGGVRLNNPNQRPNPGFITFPKKSVFISPQAVCYWDTNGIYGLDPMTGQTLWIRQRNFENCTILGDDEHMFLVFPDSRQVRALDPTSGRELADGPLPDGGTHVFGTNIVFIQRQGNDWTLRIADLRDLHDRRRRALMLTASPTSDFMPPIPTEVLHGSLPGTAMLQTFQNDRFLSVADWNAKSLDIYDLQTKKNILPAENRILQFVPTDVAHQTRCDVELIGDHILVLFAQDTQLRNTAMLQPDERGTMVRRTYRQVNGVLGFPIDRGVMMLFDSAGTPCWPEPAQIEKMARILDVPDGLPVMLFAVGIEETVHATANRHLGTRIMAIDKRTGETRFRKEVDMRQVPLQPFRVSVDSSVQEIIFTNSSVTPPRIIKASFH